MSVTQQQVLDALSKVMSPRGVALPHANVLSAITVTDGKVFFSINVDAAEARAWENVRAQTETAVRAIPGVTVAMIALTAERKPGSATPPPVPQPHRHAHGGGVQPAASHRPPQGAQNPMSKQAEIPGIAAIIAVASGKGGVGKSTTAVNLALALAAEGAKVGILDADIYGPSQPQMLGIEGRPESLDGAKLEPLTAYDLQAMSVGFLIDPETPMVWRGPMVTQALTQLLGDTNWHDLDYLVVDLPPGTGDIQLTLAQQVPVTGAIIVTTPQDIALLDARKGLKMFDKVGIPILGIVENMSIHICSKCGHEEHIFGSGGADRMGKDYEVEVLGHLPLDIKIREQVDGGKPTVVAEPDSRVAEIYRGIARRVAIKIAERAKDMTSKFPNIVIQNT